MTRSAKGALGLLVLGILAILAIYMVLEYLEKNEQLASSDAANSKGQIRIAVDNFIGYFPLCSPRIKSLLLNDGYRLECIDDQADYSSRFAKLTNGTVDFAVGTIDTYLLNGDRYDYPGVIIAVLDESKGADAIVARSTTAKNLSDLKNKNNIKVAFTPSSPSHHLLKVAGVHFDIAFLRNKNGSWRTETTGSSGALQKLLDGKVDVAAIWEPDISKALAQGEFTKILGTEETQRLIVDVLISSHKNETNTPEVSEILLANYYRALKYYRDNPSIFDDHLADYASVSEKQARQLKKGINWFTMQQNAADWMGLSSTGQIPKHGLYETIDQTLDIQRDVGDFTQNPLPSGDPRRIINSAIIKTLFEKGIRTGFSSGGSFDFDSNSANIRDFSPLDDTQWASLREVGNLRVRPIKFEAGTGKLTITGKEQIDAAVKVLENYPNFRIIIEGHTSTRGDRNINRSLSQERADAVRRYLYVTYKIDRDRTKAVGFGPDKPLPRLQGESSRAYRSKLPRVELKLVSESF